MSTETPTTRRTDTQTTRRTPPTDARAERHERESEAPLCPDVSTSWTSSQERIRQELTMIRRQLDRIERRMDAEAETQ